MNPDELTRKDRIRLECYRKNPKIFKPNPAEQPPKRLDWDTTQDLVRRFRSINKK